MNNLKIGDTLVIHCYKHNGVIYESSRVAYVLDIKDDYIVLADENGDVIYKLMGNVPLKDFIEIINKALEDR
jgi:protein associated with RNAse G/E